MNELKEILIDKKCKKVIHSAKQDIEVINYALDIKIKNIFDTQMAYNVLHGGDEIGYTNLVEKLFKIKLSKKYQVSDWESRPLSKNQLAYAENDVLYLPRIYTYLINFIKKRNLINKINIFKGSIPILLKKIAPVRFQKIPTVKKVKLIARRKSIP